MWSAALAIVFPCATGLGNRINFKSKKSAPSKVCDSIAADSLECRSAAESNERASGVLLRTHN
jgi:hypothetical protein